MIQLQNIFGQPASRALAWALLHFLWQGTLAALALAACNWALRRSAARVRYAVSCLFLILMLALPVITFMSDMAAVSLSGVSFAGVSASAMAAIPVSTAAPRSIQEALAPFLPWIVSLWITGVMVLSVRWMAARSYLHRLRRAASPIVLPEWERALRALARRAAVSTPVRLSIHRLTRVPCVIGWLRPVILMPAASDCGAGLERARSAAGA